MHLPTLIADLALILGVAAVVTYLFRRIHQPVVLGYLVAGVIVGPFTPPPAVVSDLPNIQVLAELGVIFLMFTLGLEFRFIKLARMGGPVVVASAVQIIGMVLIGFGAGRALGWNSTDALFLGAMISISSTTIIVKAFEELKLKGRRFTEFVMGMLIVEDLAAILILVLLPGAVRGEQVSAWALAGVLGQLIFVVGSWFVVGYFLVPRFVRRVVKVGSDEMLLLAAVALCLVLVAVAAHFEYSAALGAFIMGSILAETRESHRIEALVRPLRDIFGAVFFVSIGMMVNPSLIWQYAEPIAWVSLVVIVGKLLSLSIGCLVSGQDFRRTTQISLSMAQIGEFSFIIATLGQSLKVTSAFLYPVVVAVAVITTFTTPYLMKGIDPLNNALKRYLPDSVYRLQAAYAAGLVTLRSHGDRRTHGFRWREMSVWALALLICALVFKLLHTATSVPVPVEATAELAATPTNWRGAVLLTSAWVLAAPFVWAAWSAFSAARLPGRWFSRALLVALLLVLSVPLSEQSSPAQLLSAVAAILVIYLLFSRKLQRAYMWFEGQFLQTFNQDEHGHNEGGKRMDHLAPWDLHLTRFAVSPFSVAAGQTLAQLALPERWGFNVVAVQRGTQIRVTPNKDEQIFPHDEILGVGEDERLEKIRELFESGAPPSLLDVDMENYEIARIDVQPQSYFVGRRILDSQIRQRYGGLVLGIERDGQRLLNPSSQTALQQGDALWIVGQRPQLGRLRSVAAGALGELELPRD